MTFRNLAVGLLALAIGASAQAQYLLSPMAGNGQGNAGQLQIGTGLPLPVGPSGIFLGGMTPVNGGTMGCPAMVGCPPDGPGLAFWPPLLVHRRNAPATMGTIMQALTTPQGGALAVPAGILSNSIGAAPRAPIGVFPTNPAVFQVRTTINYDWPNAAATFAPGGGPGVPGTPVVLTGPGLGSITYNAGTKSFGGAAQFAIISGPFAGLPPFPVPTNGLGKIPVASVWINVFKQAPANATKALLVGASNPLGVAAPGAPGTSVATTMFGAVPNAIRLFTGALPILGVNGTIPPAQSMGIAPSALTNMVTGTQGFPWTTGFVTVTAPGAAPAEIFFQSGTDMRVAGIGNVSMVSGALGQRKLSGANANRGWVTLTLPEPTMVIGAGAALAMLGLCHTIVRRRSN
jgi:hypothetical protein